MPLQINGTSISWYVVGFVLGVTFNAGVTWVKITELDTAAKDIAVLQEKVQQLENRVHVEI